MQVEADHLQNLKFSVKARKHLLLSDQPEEDGGADEGMTPPELLLGALASCAAFYAAQYLKGRNLATSGTHVVVSADKVKNPARLDNFEIEVTCPVALTPDQLTGIERSVHQCLIHNTLLGTPTIRTSIKIPDPVQSGK